MGRRVVVVAVVVLQLGFVARGYWADHKEFAFQMFPESSTWRADVVRVTADGRRVPIERPWSGYRWDELVQRPGASYPSIRHHADAGLDNQLAFLEAALDWVAGNTPRDRETRYLEARVTVLAQRRPAPGQGPPEPCPRGRRVNAPSRAPRSAADRRVRRPARPRGQHAGPRAAEGAGRPGRAPASAAVPRPTPWTGGSTGTPSTSPTPPGIPSCPSAVYVGLLVAGGGGRRRDVARLPHPPGDGDDVRDRRLQPVPVDHALPQQPGLPGDRPGAAGGRAVRAGAVGGRVAPPPSGATGTRPLGAGLAAVAAPVRVRRDLRRVRAEQARSIPTGSAAPSPGSASCSARGSWRRGRCRTGRCRS